MSDLRINIYGRNDHNTINEKEYPKFENTSIRLKSEGGFFASKNVRIIFETSAVKPLFESIAWGTRCRPGDVEQAGILIGNYYCDHSTHNEVIWADVVLVVPADPALVRASFDRIDITADAWKKMYEDAAEFRSENLQIVGWYHTHLAHINTRFSGVDVSTQRKAFTYEYSFGVVFNPNQRKWSAFYGPQSQECVGELLFDEELSVKYGIPQITIKQVNGDLELKEDGSIVHFDREGHFIENRPEDGRGSEGIEDDNTLSFHQLVSQFFSGLMELGVKNKREKKSRRKEVPVKNELPHAFPDNRDAIYGVRQTHFTPEQASNTIVPKIEIRNSRRMIPIVKSVFYSMLTDNSFVENFDIKCIIKCDTVDEIIRYKKLKGGDSPIEDPLWGCVRQNDSNMEVLLKAPEDEVNARIFFIENDADNERSKLIAMGIKRCNEANIKYIVIIDNQDSETINMCVVHCNKGE